MWGGAYTVGPHTYIDTFPGSRVSNGTTWPRAVSKRRNTGTPGQISATAASARIRATTSPPATYPTATSAPASTADSVVPATRAHHATRTTCTPATTRSGAVPARRRTTGSTAITPTQAREPTMAPSRACPSTSTTQAITATAA